MSMANRNQYQVDANVDIYANIVINIIDKCNLSCGYCSRGSDPRQSQYLDFEVVKKVLDFIASKQIGKIPIVQLTGGEILLHKEIFKIIQYALSLNFIVRLQTNGILLPKLKIEEIEVLSHKNVIMKISLDGWNRETHERYRGKNTFNPTLKSIVAARNITPRIGIKTVIHELNFPDIDHMLDLCLELKISSWSHNILRSMGRCTDSGEITELDVVKKLVPLYNDDRYRCLLGGSNILIYHLLNKQGVKGLPLYFFVDSDGGVYITDNTNPDHKTGTVYGNNLDDQFLVENARKIPERRIKQDILSYVNHKLHL